MAATSPLAAQAGLDLIHAGGTAVDAAIAAMLVATVTEPGVVSPLGGAFVNIWPADGSPVVVDGNVEMPGRGLPRERFGAGVREIHTTYGGGLTVFAGHGSVATPGAFAAFGRAHERHGAAPWAELLAPAISAARDGFPLGAAAASYLALVHDSIFGWDEQTRAFHSAEGVPAPRRYDAALPRARRLARPPGAPRLDRPLHRRPRRAAGSPDMADRGGLVTAADLASVRPVGAARPAEHAARLERRRQPAPVDRRPGADRDAADAGAAGEGHGAGRPHPDPARGARLPAGAPGRAPRTCSRPAATSSAR